MNRKVHAPLVALAGCMMAPALARAEPMKPGFEVGLRAGYGIPMGKTSGTTRLSDTMSGKVPFLIDIGYRITPSFYAGAFGQYAVGMVKNESTSSAPGQETGDGSGSVLRVGLNVHYHLLTEGTVLPWVGIGMGYERVSYHFPDALSMDGKKGLETSIRGLEFANLQGGADVRLLPGLRAGPFASLSVGRYDTGTSSFTGTTSFELGDKTVHQWLTLGLRGAFTFLHARVTPVGTTRAR
jgi:hypothetical protein